MRRVVVLCVLMALAPAAFGNLVVTAAPGGALTISAGVNITNAMPTTFALVTETAKGSFSGLTVLNPPFDGSLYVGGMDPDAVGNGVGGIATGLDGVFGNILVDTATPIAAGTALFKLNYTGAPAMISLYLVDNDTFEVGASAVSEVFVPEPMTMALLGLGGLFIRKRLA